MNYHVTIHGDTFDAEVDLGYNVFTKQRFRLLDIDTWEKRGDQRERGIAATEFVKEIMPVDSNIILWVVDNEKDSFGRWLVKVTLQDGTDLADRLREAGHEKRIE